MRISPPHNSILSGRPHLLYRQKTGLPVAIMLEPNHRPFGTHIGCFRRVNVPHLRHCFGRHFQPAEDSVHQIVLRVASRVELVRCERGFLKRRRLVTCKRCSLVVRSHRDLLVIFDRLLLVIFKLVLPVQSVSIACARGLFDYCLAIVTVGLVEVLVGCGKICTDVSIADKGLVGIASGGGVCIALIVGGVCGDT